MKIDEEEEAELCVPELQQGTVSVCSVHPAYHKDATMQPVSCWTHGRQRGQTADMAWTRWSRRRKRPAAVQTGNTEFRWFFYPGNVLHLITNLIFGRRNGYTVQREGADNDTVWHSCWNLTLYCSLHNTNHIQHMKSPICYFKPSTVWRLHRLPQG